MPDISMCADDDCPTRHKCRRHKASGTVPDQYRQAFANFEREPEDERCGDFWPTYSKFGDMIARNIYLSGVTIHDFPDPKDEAND